jgi:hypothetical protein
LDYAGPVGTCAISPSSVAFPLGAHGRHPDCAFRSSIPRPPMPLSTLHPAPRGTQRKTRGQDGSLFLSCRALSSPTAHRFIPAIALPCGRGSDFARLPLPCGRGNLLILLIDGCYCLVRMSKSVAERWRCRKRWSAGKWLWLIEIVEGQAIRFSRRSMRASVDGSGVGSSFCCAGFWGSQAAICLRRCST